MLKLILGDITKIKADAIVNAANTSLLGGGGVDGAIHKTGGPEILEACVKIRNKQGGCEVGKAVITTAGKLPACFVIHTVGPRWNNGKSDEKAKLTSAYINSLNLAEEHGVKTLAFPNISTGIYRFPKDKAAEIAIETCRTFLKHSKHVETIYFVCFDKENYSIYENRLS